MYFSSYFTQHLKSVFLLTTLLVFFTAAAFGQYESRKGYAGFSIGASVPSGDFASISEKLEGAGYAKKGVALNLNFAYRIASNFGVTALLMIQSNKYDEDAFLKSLNTVSQSNTNQVKYTSVDADSWGLSGFLVGGFISAPLDNRGKLILEPRALFGLLTAVSPRIRGTYRGSFSTGWIEQQLGAGIAFGFSLGGGFRFNASDRIALILNADYLKTSPKFFDVAINQSNGQDLVISFQKKIEVVNVTLGFAFRIKKDVPPIKRRI